MQRMAPRIQIIALIFLALSTTSCMGADRSASSPPAETTRQPEEVIATELITTMSATAGYMTQVHAKRAIKDDPWSITRPDAREALPAATERPAEWRRGVSLGLFASEKNVENNMRIYTALLDEIAAVGATDVSIVVRWKQENVSSTEIKPSDDVTSPTDLLGRVIDAAHDRRLRVFLLPIIYLDERARGVWRGTIEPEDMDAWWASYSAFILHYARIASEHDIELYSVGSELLSMEREDRRWRELIASVRAIYKGKLTYSANWDHFEIPTFWDALDIAGMTAYQELTQAPNPSVSELNQGWSSLRGRLNEWSARTGREYIFTEIGFPSHREGAAHPWDYTSQSIPAHDLQARCFRSMFEVWDKEEKLGGVYIWNWFGFRDPEDRGYTPRGKPAEEVLRHWYKSSRPSPE